MTLRPLFIGLLVLAAAMHGATPFDGDWHGSLDLGPARSLPLAIHVMPGPAATLDSPQQGAYDIPADATVVEGDSISIRFDSLGLDIRGRLSGDSIAAGVSQHGYAADVVLLRGPSPAVDRPQTPSAPLPYPVEDFAFASDALGGAVLSGTLTAPEGARTAVVMVSGSGLQDRDETICGHKPFAVIADHLARRGIAALRYDDRGFGASTGRESVGQATTDIFADDARAAVEALRATGRFGSIGVLGHSEGGTIALMLAAEPGLIDFAIGLGAPALRGDSILVEQNRLALLETGVDADAVERYCRAFADVARFAAAYGPGPALSLQAATASGTLGDGPVEKQLAANLRDAAKTLATPWMRRFTSLDPRPLVAGAACHVLLLYGGLDRQVVATSNAGAARSLSAMVDVKVLPSLNHLMQTAMTGSPQEYGLISETVAPAALDEIASFAAAH